jgi:putative addiction module component (TIGR02574 family)
MLEDGPTVLREIETAALRARARTGKRAILRYMEREMSKVLDEALRLPARERVAIAEKLLESAEAEGYDDDEDEIQAAWAEEIQRRSRELRDGTVKGLSVEEARRIVASDPPDDER